jgi:hypothetical protein
MKVVLLLIAMAATAALSGAQASAQEPQPSASPRPGCGTPAYQSLSVEPSTAAPGDTVTVTVLVRDEPCYPDESQPHDVQLFAAYEPHRDPAPLARGTTDAAGRFVHVEKASVSVTYYLSVSDNVRRGGNSDARLTVGRTLGSCANALTLYANPTADVGTQVLLHATSSDTSTVSIAFRRRGQTGFSVRRQFSLPNEYASYKTYFTADDDYRIYAFNERCDSPRILVAAAPVVSGPVKVRTGSIVTLSVRATPGMPLELAFRRAGQTTFSVRRTGTANSSGVLTTTYRADADYEYFAQERPGQRSAARITQAR